MDTKVAGKAEEEYRSLWSAYLVSDNSARVTLERRMDDLQSQIAEGPNDPRWVTFKNSLVGYDEFWQEILHEIQQKNVT